MAYILRYSVTVKEITSNGLGMNGTSQITGVAGPPNGQQLQFFASGPVGSNTFTATDIANFVTSIGTDITNQLTAAQARIQNFGSGGG